MAEPRLVVLPGGADVSPADDALMLRSAAGDTQAFRALVARHEASLRRFCASIVRDPETARELAQDVFLRVWRDRGGYRGQGRFRAYLFTIARNRCRSWNRRAGLLRLVGLNPGPERADPVALDAPLLARESIAIVDAALARLPEKFRTPLLLRYAEGLAYEEIAAVIGRTPSAARSRVFYGLKALAELLPEEVEP